MESSIAKIRNILTPYKNYFTFLKDIDSNVELRPLIEKEKEKCIAFFPILEELLEQAEREVTFVHKATSIRCKVYYNKRYKIVNDIKTLSDSLKEFKKKSNKEFEILDGYKESGMKVEDYKDTISYYQRQIRFLTYKIKQLSRELNKLDVRFKKQISNYQL